VPAPNGGAIIELRDRLIVILLRFDLLAANRAARAKARDQERHAKRAGQMHVSRVHHPAFSCFGQGVRRSASSLA
jgi:hypothetical protein